MKENTYPSNTPSNRNKPTMIVGGRAIVCPCVQRVQRIPLSTMTLVIESPRVYTSQGVPISVTGVAQVSSSSTESIRSERCMPETGRRKMKTNRRWYLANKMHVKVSHFSK